MQKYSKAILIALAVLVALGIAGLMAVNLYLQSPASQARIQEELSRAFRLPLKITNTSFTPWNDLRITGITVPHGDTNLLEAASFNARYRLGPLLRRKLVISRVTMESPKIVWVQDAEEKWTLPKPGKAAEVSAEHPPAAAEEKPEKARKKSKLEVVVEGGRIERGLVELRDKEGQPIATFIGVTMDFTRLENKRVEGQAQIGRAAWEGKVVLEQVKTPFKFHDGRLELPELEARLGGGFLTGKITWQPDKKRSKPTDLPSPFTSKLEFQHVDLTRVALDAGWTEGAAAGALRGTVELAGSTKEFARAQGRAQLFLRNGRFQNMFYLDMIGTALQIRELRDLKLNDSQAEVRIADEKAFLENVTLNAADLQLSATGVAKFDGTLKIAAHLTARDRLFERLPVLVQNKFGAAGDGSRFIDFSITGKTNKPKTDLLEKIIGQAIETQFDELLSSVFNTKKKPEEQKDDPKKKDDKADRKKKADARIKEEPKAKDDKKKKPDAAKIPLAPTPAALVQPAPPLPEADPAPADAAAVQ